MGDVDAIINAYRVANGTQIEWISRHKSDCILTLNMKILNNSLPS